MGTSDLRLKTETNRVNMLHVKIRIMEIMEHGIRIHNETEVYF